MPSGAFAAAPPRQVRAHLHLDSKAVQDCQQSAKSVGVRARASTVSDWGMPWQSCCSCFCVTASEASAMLCMHFLHSVDRCPLCCNTDEQVYTCTAHCQHHNALGVSAGQRRSHTCFWCNACLELTTIATLTMLPDTLLQTSSEHCPLLHTVHPLHALKYIAAQQCNANATRSWHAGRVPCHHKRKMLLANPS